MERLLRELTAVPGVAGGFVFDLDGSVLSTAPRALFEELSTQQAARDLVAALAMLQSLGADAGSELDLRFERGRLLLRRAPGAGLALLCVPDVDLPLLGLRAGLALKGIARQLDERRRARPGPELRERLERELCAALGARAERPLALLRQADSSPGQLAAACTEAVRFTRLFIGQPEAQDLERRIRAALQRDA
jgi:predicted regulator of Ras-like GTPase activity (Roadblock/LC7/MglB family)